MYTYVLDASFWETVLVFGLLGASILITVQTRATPLFWISLLFACLEAGVRQLYMTLRVAVNHYRKSFPDTLRSVRAEVMGRTK